MTKEETDKKIRYYERCKAYAEADLIIVRKRLAHYDNKLKELKEK